MARCRMGGGGRSLCAGAARAWRRSARSWTGKEGSPIAPPAEKLTNTRLFVHARAVCRRRRRTSSISPIWLGWRRGRGGWDWLGRVAWCTITAPGPAWRSPRRRLAARAVHPGLCAGGAISPAGRVTVVPPDEVVVADGGAEASTAGGVSRRMSWRASVPDAVSRRCFRGRLGMSLAGRALAAGCGRWTR